MSAGGSALLCFCEGPPPLGGLFFTCICLCTAQTVNSVAERGFEAMAAGRHSREKLNLTGQKFGRLTVLAPAENIGTQTAWLCRCECGGETIAVTKRLRDGHCTSCGCDKDHLGEPPSVVGRASLTFMDGTCVEMLRAKTVRKNNTSGVPGVDWMEQQRLWRATICFKGKRYYLGGFRNFEDAVQARKRGEEQFFDSFLREFDGNGGNLPANGQAVVGQQA